MQSLTYSDHETACDCYATFVLTTRNWFPHLEVLSLSPESLVMNVPWSWVKESPSLCNQHCNLLATTVLLFIFHLTPGPSSLFGMCLAISITIRIANDQITCLTEVRLVDCSLSLTRIPLLNVTFISEGFSEFEKSSSSELTGTRHSLSVYLG